MYQEYRINIREHDVVSEKSLYCYSVFYLILIHIVIFFNVFSSFRISTVFVDIYGLFAAFYAVVVFGVSCCNNKKKLSLLDWSVGVFILYSLCSVYLYFLPFNPASIDAYFYGIHLLVMPSFTYYAVSSITEPYQQKLLRAITALHLIMAIIGLILFVWRPDFYTENLRAQFDRSGIEELYSLYSRLGSYMGSTATGILSAITIAIISMCNYRLHYKYIMIVVLVITVLLTQQRGAYISATMALVFFLASKKNLNMKYIVIIIGFFVIVFSYMLNSSNLTISRVPEIIWNRVTNDIIKGDLRSERSESFVKGVKVSLEYPLGMGIGATTSAADDAGANPIGQIVDSNYMRIICDLGFAGFYLFLAVIAVSVYTIFKNKKPIYYLLLIFIYCFQANFTNVFDVYYVNHLFWLILGLINAKSSV